MEQKLFFDTVSDIYDKTRPGYVEELYRDLYQYRKIGNDSKVLEVGIGNGQATGPILATGCSLTAIEIGENFTEMVRKKYSSYRKFSVINVDFMDYDSSQNEYDLIYSGTAFHWIPEAEGYQKVRSLLKPGGVFARFANRPGPSKNQPDLHVALQRLYEKYFGQTDKDIPEIENLARERAQIAEKYGFVNVIYKIYTRKRILTSDEYILLLHTYSDHMMMDDKKRKEFFSFIKKEIDSLGGSIIIQDSIDLELATKR